jgi:hypothetical protein
VLSRYSWRGTLITGMSVTTKPLLRWILGATAVFAAAVATFLAYQQPALLLDFLNFRYCG